MAWWFRASGFRGLGLKGFRGLGLRGSGGFRCRASYYPHPIKMTTTAADSGATPLLHLLL